jgi:hypothetical protein
MDKKRAIQKLILDYTVLNYIILTMLTSKEGPKKCLIFAIQKQPKNLPDGFKNLPSCKNIHG